MLFCSKIAHEAFDHIFCYWLFGILSAPSCSFFELLGSRQVIPSITPPWSHAYPLVAIIKVTSYVTVVSVLVVDWLHVFLLLEVVFISETDDCSHPYKGVRTLAGEAIISFLFGYRPFVAC